MNAKQIEENPLRHTEGSYFSSSESVTKTDINKSCQEGVEFEIDIIKQLIIENELLDGWGKWQDRSMAINKKDIAPSWRKELVKEGYYDKHNWSRATYQGVREEDPLVQIELRQFIADRLGLDINNINHHITVGYDEKEVKIFHFSTIPEIARLNYQYREKIKEFREKGEYWQVTTEEAEKLAEANECHEINRVCLDAGNKTFSNKYIINRPCWQEKISYQCYSEPQAGCKHLKSQGCQLENSIA